MLIIICRRVSRTEVPLLLLTAGENGRDGPNRPTSTRNSSIRRRRRQRGGKGWLATMVRERDRADIKAMPPTRAVCMQRREKQERQHQEGLRSTTTKACRQTINGRSRWRPYVDRLHPDFACDSRPSRLRLDSSRPCLRDTVASVAETPEVEKPTTAASNAVFAFWRGLELWLSRVPYRYY